MLKQGNRLYAQHVKRILDFAVSLLLLVVLAPVFLAVGIAVRVNMGSPVVFRQQRPGKGGELFDMYKFRTMSDARDAEGNLLPDGARLTRFGKALRRTSLDELPELWNVLKGDMSIVGPRPLLVRYLPLYDERQRHRHDVRPGITGLAQVNGRNSISWEEKFEWDIAYVEGVSFLGDLRIAVKTVRTVLGRKGVSSSTSATMEEFRGALGADGNRQQDDADVGMQ